MGDETLAAITELNSVHGKLTNAELRLKLARKNEEARQLGDKAEELRKQIDKLRGEAADKWVQQAQALAADVRKHNAQVEGYIQDIQKSIETAQNVVKLIGAVDDVIGKVKGVVG